MHVTSDEPICFMINSRRAAIGLTQGCVQRSAGFIVPVWTVQFRTTAIMTGPGTVKKEKQTCTSKIKLLSEEKNVLDPTPHLLWNANVMYVCTTASKASPLTANCSSGSLLFPLFFYFYFYFYLFSTSGMYFARCKFVIPVQGTWHSVLNHFLEGVSKEANSSRDSCRPLTRLFIVRITRSR